MNFASHLLWWYNTAAKTNNKESGKMNRKRGRVRGIAKSNSPTE
jgi:hypothetical protein